MFGESCEYLSGPSFESGLHLRSGMPRGSAEDQVGCSDEMGWRLGGFYPFGGAVNGCGGKERGVLADGGELYVAEAGELAVVVTEDGNVGRYLQSGCPEAFHDAEGCPVVEGDDG